MKDETGARCACGVSFIHSDVPTRCIPTAIPQRVYTGIICPPSGHSEPVSLHSTEISPNGGLHILHTTRESSVCAWVRAHQESTVSSHATASSRASHALRQSTTIYPATTGSGSGCGGGSTIYPATIGSLPAGGSCGCGGPVGEGSSLRFFPLATLEVGAGGAQAMGSGRAAGLGVALAPCVLAWQTARTAACCSPLSDSQPKSSGSRASEGTRGTL